MANGAALRTIGVSATTTQIAGGQTARSVVIVAYLSWDVILGFGSFHEHDCGLELGCGVSLYINRQICLEWKDKAQRSQNCQGAQQRKYTIEVNRFPRKQRKGKGVRITRMALYVKIHPWEEPLNPASDSYSRSRVGQAGTPLSTYSASLRTEESNSGNTARRSFIRPSQSAWA